MEGHILIVDDQPGIRLLLKDIFLNEGFKVKTADNGQMALEKMNVQPFDLVILDNQLPIFTGAEVLGKMISAGIRTPVILMSGLVEDLKEELKDNDLLLGVISKPFNIQELCKLVHTKLVCTCHDHHSR